MSVEFIDPLQTPGVYIKPTHPGNETRGIIGFLIRRGIVNNEEQANYVLLIISIIFLLITGYVIFGIIKKANIPIQTATDSFQRSRELEQKFTLPLQ
jgi:hypothetical protein